MTDKFYVVRLFSNEYITSKERHFIYDTGMHLAEKFTSKSKAKIKLRQTKKYLKNKFKDAKIIGVDYGD